MPIQFEWDLENTDFPFFCDFPSEDIWKKFDLEEPIPTSDELLGLNLQSNDWFSDISASTLFNNLVNGCSTTTAPATTNTTPSAEECRTSLEVCTGASEIRMHDCMWAGLCHSRKDHCKPVVSVSSKTSVCSQPVVTSSPTPESKKSPKVISTESVTRVKVEPVVRPETPQSLSESDQDDEDESSNQLIYSRGVKASEVTGQVRRPEPTKYLVTPPVLTSANSCSANAELDHAYDAKHSVRTDDLGVQTPSDSEEDEEIDVVSLSSKGSDYESSSCGVVGTNLLPTNPTRRMKEEIQDTVEQIANSKLMLASKMVSQRLRTKVINSSRSSSSGPRRIYKRKRASSDDESDNFTLGSRRGRHLNRGYSSATSSPSSRRSPKKARISTDSETDSTEKRSLHNNMERMRRIDLRNAFDDLRTLVPVLTDSTRAAKVTILKEAANYCHELTSSGKYLQSQLASLRKEQEKLRANLSRLRRELASQR